MGYIGAEPATSFETVRKDRFTSQTGTTVTLSHTVSSVNDILVMVNSVKQDYTNYSVNGTTLTLGGSLVSADIVEVTYIGRTFQTVSPDTNTITNAMMSDDAIDSAEIVDGAVDSVHTNFVSTSSAAGLQIKGDGTTDGTLQLNCSQNSHGIKIKSPPHSANADYTLTMPNNDGSANEYLQTNGSGVLTWAGVSGTTINNNANNKVITGSGTANTLEGEANLQFDGTNLGIGKSPSRTLDMTSNGDFFVNLNDGTNASVGSTNRGLNFYAGGSIPLKLTTNSATITHSSSGASAPAEFNTLILDASGDAGISILTGSNSRGGINFGDSEDVDIGNIYYNHDSNEMTFGVNASTRMSIVSGGDVRIFPTGAKLSVGGAGATSGYVLGSVNNDIKLIGETGAGLRRGSNNTEIWYDGSQMYPNVDNSKNLGHASYRYGTLYATNGTINTSDRNEKENINDSELGIDFLNKLRPVQYTWKNKTTPERLYKEGDVIPEDKKIGDVWTEEETTNHKRRHYGLIAQEVETVLTDNNISTENFAPFIKTKKYIQDESNHKLTEQEDYSYGMRYTELIGILIKGMQELSTKNNALETKVTTLETNVADLTTRLEALENA